MQSNDVDSWDQYWLKSRDSSILQKLYARIATFYRIKLISPRLKHELLKAFPNGGKLLHAGSGGGEVDQALSGVFDVTAIDISPNAIASYKNLNPKNKTLIGDILSLDLNDSNFDGYYNLGVMEHFSQKQCEAILQNANKVLKTGGKIVIFWPPSYGVSVIFLSLLHFCLKLIKRKNFVPLHPEEPNKVFSRKRILVLVNKSGFELKRFNFSIRDGFTYVVIVAEKS